MELVWLVPVTGLAAVLFALWLARDVLSRDTGTPAMQEIAGMIFEGAMAFLAPPVPDDRDPRGRHGGRDRRDRRRRLGWREANRGYQTASSASATNEVVSRWEEGLLTGIAFLVGAACSGARRLHRHVHRRALERADRRRRPEEPQGRDHRRRSAAAPSPGFLVVALSLLGVSGIFLVYSRVLGNPPRDRAVPHRRLRLRRQLRRAVRPARRRHLHQGRRRRRRPRRQGRGGHPRGRPAQRRRRRRPRRRQRRRLRRPWRRPLRVDVRREHRRDDPRRRRSTPSPATSSGSCSRWCCARSASSRRSSA